MSTAHDPSSGHDVDTSTEVDTTDLDTDTEAGTETDDDLDLERAERLAAETARHNEDEETTREAIEQELSAAGLSEEGEHLGQHND